MVVADSVLAQLAAQSSLPHSRSPPAGLGRFYSYTRDNALVEYRGGGIRSAGGRYLAITGQWERPGDADRARCRGGNLGWGVDLTLQDVSFDRENGLYSVPATYGEVNALGIARALHLTTVAALAIAGVGAGAGALYFAGVVVAGLLLLYEHSLVKSDDFSRLDAAFFTMNGVISIVFFGFVFTERLLR